MTTPERFRSLVRVIVDYAESAVRFSHHASLWTRLGDRRRAKEAKESARNYEAQTNEAVDTLLAEIDAAIREARADEARDKFLQERIKSLMDDADHTLSGQQRLLCLYEIRGIRTAMDWKQEDTK